MIPTHQPLTVKDLNLIGVTMTLLGFSGFIFCLWLLIWLGVDKEGRTCRLFKWLAVGTILGYAIMLWGLAKA